MSSRPMRRRDLLLGLGAGGALLSPFARSLTAHAQAKPGNFVFFFTPNGFVRSAFGSDGNDAGFTLRQGMKNAEPMKQHISVVRGLSMKTQTGGRPFHDQVTRLLTCQPGNAVSIAFGPSIDHVIAGLTGTTPVTLSVYWAATMFNNGTYVGLSWKAPGIWERYVNDPRVAYKNVFGSFMPSGTGAEAQALIDQKKSVLDHVTKDVDLFRGRLTGSDRNRLDVHFDALRQYEKKLGSVGGTTPAPNGACMDKAMRASTYAPPPVGGSGRYDIPAFKAHGDVQMDLLVASFACGIRNSGTLMWQAAASGINPNGGSGKADDHHNVSHNEAPRDVWINIDNYYAGRYADFLKRLGDAGVLDKTVVVWGSEIAESHSHNNCTFVVGGGKALGIKHQKTINLPYSGNEGAGLAGAQNSRDFADLFTAVGKACGMKENFGKYSTGGISELWSG